MLERRRPRFKAQVRRVLDEVIDEREIDFNRVREIAHRRGLRGGGGCAKEGRERTLGSKDSLAWYYCEEKAVAFQWRSQGRRS